jgi:class 3 adenylate cyclase/tetratricopeptide (TPR) repeat protein
MLICGNCRAENPEGFRHCGQCGAPLAAPVSERRKLATLVFSDLSGSTALGERFDPETVRSLMLSYFQEMRGVLEGHGGTVEKFVGDAVLAVFGVPEAHEDDALRACRAALEMQARLPRLNEEFERRFGTRIALRIGVNTGEVVAGDPASRETFVTGDAVNVAARLEQTAGPDEVLLGELTFKLVRDAVRAEAVDPLMAKGKSEPLVAYRLLEVAGFGPVPRGGRARFTGRVDDLALLEREFRTAVADSELRVATVLGEPGVGKSRLVAEFVSGIGPGARVARGACLPYGEGITYWAIAQIIRDVARISDEHSLAEARALTQAHVEGLPDGNVVAAKITQLIGLAEGSATPSETGWAVRQFLAAGAIVEPLVVIVDDTHWAEPTLLDLLADLRAAKVDAPILLLCLARPELLELRSEWPVTVRLEPLGLQDVDALLESLLGAAPVGVRTRLANASAGNPLFVEELVAMLLDEGVLRLQDGTCILDGDLDALALPASLNALLGARLDRLEPDVRATLERGAVEGEVFHEDAAIALSPRSSRPSVPAHLVSLADKDFVRAATASFAGQAAFRFKHILVRDAAYGAMAKRLRATLHERFADWLERTAGERVTEYEEILGYHLERSYRYRTELDPSNDEIRALGDRAANRLAAAGHRAHARGDLSAASSLFVTAAEISSRPFQRAEYELLRGTVAQEALDFATAKAVLARVRGDAVEAGWPGLEAGAELGLAMVSLHTGTRETTSGLRETGGRALSIFEQLGDDRGTAAALVFLARERLLVLHWADAEDLLERAVVSAERSGDRRLVATVLVDLARAAVFGPRPVEDAVSRCEALHERARAIGPMAGASISMMLGVLEASVGNADRSRALEDDGKAVMDELAPGAVLSFGHYSALASLILGDPEHADRELSSVGKQLQQRGERGIASTVAALRSRAMVELGRFEEAERVATMALAWADADDVVSHAYARGALARSLAARDRMREALENAHMAVELSSRGDFLNGRADALFDLAMVLDAAGDRRAAQESASAALALYHAKGNVETGKRVATLLDRLDAGGAAVTSADATQRDR